MQILELALFVIVCAAVSFAIVCAANAQCGGRGERLREGETERPTGRETFSMIAGEMYMSEADTAERIFKVQTLTSLVDYGFIEAPPSVWERSNKKECIEFRRKFNLFWERYNEMLLFYLEALLNTALEEEDKQRYYMIKQRLFWSEPKREQSADHGGDDRRAAGDKHG